MNILLGTSQDLASQYLPNTVRELQKAGTVQIIPTPEAFAEFPQALRDLVADPATPPEEHLEWGDTLLLLPINARCLVELASNHPSRLQTVLETWLDNPKNEEYPNRCHLMTSMTASAHESRYIQDALSTMRNRGCLLHQAFTGARGHANCQTWTESQTWAVQQDLHPLTIMAQSRLASPENLAFLDRLNIHTFNSAYQKTRQLDVVSKIPRTFGHDDPPSEAYALRVTAITLLWARTKPEYLLPGQKHQLDFVDSRMRRLTPSLYDYFKFNSLYPCLLETLPTSGFLPYFHEAKKAGAEALQLHPSQGGYKWLAKLAQEYLQQHTHTRCR